MVNMVGFQTKLTYPAQKEVFSLIPGLARAEFVRLGSIHRNTFIRAPEMLNKNLQFKGRPGLLLAGQITGVEGYVESTAMGLLAGRNAARLTLGLPLNPPPADTAHGALLGHLTNAEVKHFQPSNINFGLFPGLDKKLPKKIKGQYRAKLALTSLEQWQDSEKISQFIREQDLQHHMKNDNKQMKKTENSTEIQKLLDNDNQLSSALTLLQGLKVLR